MVEIDISCLVTAEKEENVLDVCLSQQGSKRTSGQKLLNTVQGREVQDSKFWTVFKVFFFFCMPPHEKEWIEGNNILCAIKYNA